MPSPHSPLARIIPQGPAAGASLQLSERAQALLDPPLDAHGLAENPILTAPLPLAATDLAQLSAAAGRTGLAAWRTRGTETALMRDVEERGLGGVDPLVVERWTSHPDSRVTATLAERLASFAHRRPQLQQADPSAPLGTGEAEQALLLRLVERARTEVQQGPWLDTALRMAIYGQYFGGSELRLLIEDRARAWLRGASVERRAAAGYHPVLFTLGREVPPPASNAPIDARAVQEVVARDGYHGAAQLASEPRLTADGAALIARLGLSVHVTWGRTVGRTLSILARRGLLPDDIEPTVRALLAWSSRDKGGRATALGVPGIVRDPDLGPRLLATATPDHLDAALPLLSGRDWWAVMHAHFGPQGRSATELDALARLLADTRAEQLEGLDRRVLLPWLASPHAGVRESATRLASSPGLVVTPGGAPAPPPPPRARRRR